MSYNYCSEVGVALVAYKMDLDLVHRLSNSVGKFDYAYKVVCDNSPTESLKNLFVSLGWTYLHRPDNPGFGASHNLILDKFGSRSKFHFIVNPDISFNVGILLKLVSFLVSNNSAVCVAPKIINPDGSDQLLHRRTPSVFNLAFRRFPIKFVRNWAVRRSLIHVDDGFDGYLSVPFVSGCCVLYRSDVIQSEIGFFDERYFMYFEDADLSRKFWVYGLTPYVLFSAVVEHDFARESIKSLRMFLIHFKSTVKYFVKWGFMEGYRIDKLAEEFNKNLLKS